MTLAQPTRRRPLRARGALLGLGLILGWGGSATAQPPLEAETATVAELDFARASEWVWVTDFVGGFGAGRNMLFDVGSGGMLGMLNTGAAPGGIQVDPGRREVIAVETHFARGARGARSDVVTVYDLRTLEVKHEIELPPKTYVGAVRAGRAALLDGGRFLVSYNFNGGQSVSVTDLERRRFAGEIETAGCAFAYPLGPSRFFMICGDGALLDVQLDGAGKLASTRRTGALPGFGPDLVFDHAERAGPDWILLSLRGRVLRVGPDRRGRLAVRQIAHLGEPPDRGDGPLHPRPGAGQDVARWQPTGLQPFAVSPSGELFVLTAHAPRHAYQDGADTVDVFNLADGTRLRRLKLAAPAGAIAIVGDGGSRLVAAHGGAMSLEVYDPASGARVRSIPEAAVAPLYLQAGR